ncbi:MAG: sel1 repeat family protein [Desulfarculaceae bacterium]|nr:sel1 repeat family protein [Desulfarculaceae bacterium]
MSVKHLAIIVLVLVFCLPPLAASARDDYGYQLPYRGEEQKKSIADLLSKAKAGDLKAQELLGERYLKGINAPQHFGWARKWYLRAAQQGSAQAMWEVATLCVEGKGGPKDLVQAYFWYTLAASKGIGQAVYLRNRLHSKLTSEEVERVQTRTSQWKPHPEGIPKP